MRLNKYQTNILRAQKRTAALVGKGVFVYRNNTSGDLFLPRPTKSGITRVAKNGVFQGDDYYMFLVHNGELRLVQVIEPVQKDEVTDKMLSEGVSQNTSEQLITEQPPTVTNEGTVEFHVKSDQQKPLNEDGQPKKDESKTGESDVLLNEDPLDGVEII